jgi:hypothetical protein
MHRVIFAAAALCALASAQSTYYVAPTGSDTTGNGSSAAPWATIARATLLIPDDGSIIIVRNGTYAQTVIQRDFTSRVLIRAENAYAARLRMANEVVVSFYYAANIELSGFDIARTNPSTTGALAVKIAGSRNITLRNNIIHESFNNDLLKINEEARGILVVGNVFRNQQGEAGQHIDVNGCMDVTIRDNIFFNDAAAAGISQATINRSHGYIVVKNSGNVAESRRTRIVNNVFLNFQGGEGSNFVLIGEDAKPFHEAHEVDIENNLMLGNSPTWIRAPLSIKGGRDILFRNNTVVGDLPGRAFAARFVREGDNPALRDIHLLNNIWSDPTGTMDDFSDGPAADTVGLVLDNNLYWNGGAPIPSDDEVLNAFTDIRGLTANPRLPGQAGLILPNWNGTQFTSGTRTVRAEFERLVRAYGTLGTGSPAIGRSDTQNSPAVDILGAQRGIDPDLGAVESGSTTGGLRLALFRERVLGGTAMSMNSVFLTGTAGGTVLLSSSNPSVASVPPSVIVPGGDEAASFVLTTRAVTAATRVTITATFGGVTQTASVTVAPQGVVTFALRQENPAGDWHHYVFMEGPAAAAIPLTLSSSRPDLVTFPEGGTVAAGASHARVLVRCDAVTEPTPITVTARYGTSQASGLFTFQPSGVSLASVAVSPASISSGATATGTVRLTAAAPAGGAVVALASSATSAATVPANVTVAAGATTATFTVQARSVTATTAVTITGTYGGVSRTAALTVSGTAQAPAIWTLSVPPAPRGGESTSLTVTLAAAAPAGGAVVALNTSRADLFPIPASVTVPAGSSRASVDFNVPTVGSTQTGTISAGCGGATRTATLTVSPATLTSIYVNPSVTGGTPTSLTFHLSSPAPATGVVVNLAASATNLVTLPARVTVPGGAYRFSVSVTPAAVAVLRTVTITATAAGVSRTASMTINPPVLTSIYAGTTVVAGRQMTITLFLNSVAPAGGLAVATTSSRRDLIALPPAIIVPAGINRVNYTFTASAVSSMQNVTITGVAGATKTAALSVMP